MIGAHANSAVLSANVNVEPTNSGETCGVPVIHEQLKNVTIQQGETARCFSTLLHYFLSDISSQA